MGCAATSGELSGNLHSRFYGDCFLKVECLLVFIKSAVLKDTMEEQSDIVLIGSQALSHYGWPLEGKHDWDIICTENQNKHLYKKAHGWSCYGWYNSFTLKDKRIDCVKVEGAKKQVFEKCNSILKEKCMVLANDDLGTVIIPPLEILYALKKAHIHRMLQGTASTDGQPGR